MPVDGFRKGGLCRLVAANRGAVGACERMPSWRCARSREGRVRPAPGERMALRRVGFP